MLYFPPKKDVKFFFPILGDIKTFTWAAEIAQSQVLFLSYPVAKSSQTERPEER